MEYAKKMALVPHELLATMQSHHAQLTSPVVKSLTSLDREMEQILLSQELGDDDKLKRYNQVLQKYLNLQTKKREPLQIAVVPTAGTDEDKNELPQTVANNEVNPMDTDVLQSVPKTMQRKAQLLLNKLKLNDLVKWNERGELIYNGSALPGTHAIDLINDVLRKRKNFNPTGWREFAQILSTMNVPQDLVGNKERWKWMHSQDKEVAETSDKSKRIISTPIRPRYGKRKHVWSEY